MSNPQFDVTAIGNAIVDVIAQADDALSGQAQAAEGRDEPHRRRDRRAPVRRTWAPARKPRAGRRATRSRASRRSAARTAYIGKVAKDQLGDVFTHDMRAVGVTYDTPPLVGGLPTARSLILVTPDAQRTMQTFLGATTQLGPEDVNMQYITGSKVLYLEGYLWDQPRAKEAMRNAAIAAQKAGVKVSFTLSDSFCVARYRAEFLELVEKHVDILFANEHEILSLYEVENFDDALQKVRGHCEIAALTRSEKGSVVLARRRGARDRRRAGREGRGHDRRRRRLRGRVPLRLHAGSRPGHLRPPRAARWPRR